MVQVHLVDAHDSQSQPVCVQARSPGLEYFVEHVNNHLLLLTNKPSGSAYTTSGRTSPSSCPESVVSSSPPALATPPSAAGLSAVCGNGSDYALMTIPAAALQRGQSRADQWCLLIAERHDVAIVDMDVFSSCIVLHELAAGRPALTVLRLAAAQQQEDSQAPYLRVVQQQQVGPSTMSAGNDLHPPDPTGIYLHHIHMVHAVLPATARMHTGHQPIQEVN